MMWSLHWSNKQTGLLLEGDGERDDRQRQGDPKEIGQLREVRGVLADKVHGDNRDEAQPADYREDCFHGWQCRIIFSIIKENYAALQTGGTVY